MNPIYEEDLREEAVFEVAKKMAIAARTAPKGRGVDNTVISLVKHEGIKAISDQMKEMVAKYDLPEFFLRDAGNILSSPVIINVSAILSRRNKASNASREVGNSITPRVACSSASSLFPSPA